MTTRDMKALRRGVIILGMLFLLADLANTHCDRNLNNLLMPHG